MAESPRVLSIQSHVVFGYVGNKSATFPLQVLGFDVDPLNSVQFSNHTGYATVKGQALTEKELGDLVDGLVANKLDYYTHLLTGYIATSSFLLKIADLVKHLKRVNPNLIYVCDPVLGDNGKLYVPEELVPLYKNVITPLADILTPNQFEAELLTERKIYNLDDAQQAIEVLHKMGPKTVVLSSTDLGNEKILLGIASTKLEGVNEEFIIDIPKIPAMFTGTGDLFAALFLAWMHKSKYSLKDSLEKTVATMQAVLKKTFSSVQGKTEINENHTSYFILIPTCPAYSTIHVCTSNCSSGKNSNLLFINNYCSTINK
ncbi:pyridoxal kinase [Agrilus planipennis]|uniref:Pyridoxal kinase n=1 Tax=Agrilus planipennis TaxID=224129 RepID=A0A1W4X968_AGRPL|nr:pyridoxal kinase [Agrilus planipennis]